MLSFHVKEKHILFFFFIGSLAFCPSLAWDVLQEQRMFYQSRATSWCPRISSPNGICRNYESSAQRCTQIRPWRHAQSYRGRSWQEGKNHNDGKDHILSPEYWAHFILCFYCCIDLANFRSLFVVWYCIYYNTQLQ